MILYYYQFLQRVLIVIQSTVLARPFLSVHHSVMFWYCVQTNEDTIIWFSASGRTIFLVSGEVKFIRIFADGVRVRHPSVYSENSTNNRP